MKNPPPTLSRQRSRIPEGDRIPLLQKITFSLGGKMQYISTDLTINVLWMPFFNIGLGINPALLGIGLMLMRAWDAISDPIMGNISDNARTRWGRRRPFMAAGAILTGILYPFLWRPPSGWGETGVLLYLVVIGLLFFTSFTCWSMPYFALQLELTPNYDERTRLMAWTALFGKLVSLAGGWVMAILASQWFANPETGEADIVTGLQICSWVMAGVIIVMGLLPVIFVRERYYETETSKQTRDPFWTSIRESFRCRPLWYLIGVSFFLVLGNASIASLGQYVNIYFVNAGKLADATIVEGWKFTAMLVFGICTIPLWTWLSEIFDKKLVVSFLFVMGICGHLLYGVCLNPELPYLQLIPAVMESGALAAVWLFLPSMKADVADYDELQTTRRREGALNAFYSWFIKAAMTCAMGLGGLTLTLTGFDVGVAEQPPEVLARMKWTFIVLPVVVWSLGLAFMMLYPLNRKGMAAIRGQLEVRRGKL
ncbi:MAG: MFS transporter [Verrucomicrobiota bacterium JB024]|nr:MFS transporter [Verrucomicrobiota bacterium JB024]